MSRINRLTCALLLLLAPLALYALATPSNTIMNIVADSSQYSYKTGENWFEGQVKIDQDQSHLRADRVITKKNAQNKIQEAIAFGLQQPAHYWSYPKKKGDKVLHAYAKLMKLYPLQSRIVLEGDVRVIQGENRFQGQIIVYNIKQQTIIVPPSKNSRATFVIEADRIKQAI